MGYVSNNSFCEGQKKKKQGLWKERGGSATPHFCAPQSRDDPTRRGADAVEDARSVDRDVLLRDELDRFLRDEATEEGCDLGEVRSAGTAAAEPPVHQCQFQGSRKAGREAAYISPRTLAKSSVMSPPSSAASRAVAMSVRVRRSVATAASSSVSPGYRPSFSKKVSAAWNPR